MLSDIMYQNRGNGANTTTSSHEWEPQARAASELTANILGLSCGLLIGDGDLKAPNAAGAFGALFTPFFRLDINHAGKAVTKFLLTLKDKSGCALQSAVQLC